MDDKFVHSRIHDSAIDDCDRMIDELTNKAVDAIKKWTTEKLSCELTQLAMQNSVMSTIGGRMVMAHIDGLEKSRKSNKTQAIEYGVQALRYFRVTFTDMIRRIDEALLPQEKTQ
jgi:hypothetical protein